MGRKTFGLVIGYLSVVLYAISICYLLYAIIAFGGSDGEKSRDGYGTKIGVMIFMLILVIIMTMISVMLIMGINKDRPNLMAPWVYLTIAGIVMNIIRLFTAGGNILGPIVTIIIQCAVWYPIYTLYKDIRAQKLNQNSTTAASATGPKDYPPTSYNQVPSNA